MSDYFCPLNSAGKIDKLDSDCKLAEKAHTVEKAQCMRAQESFESNFCQWKTKVTDNCQILSQCYKNAETSYSDVKSKTSKLVKQLKTEYASLQKINCYLQVWLKDD